MKAIEQNNILNCSIKLIDRKIKIINDKRIKIIN